MRIQLLALTALLLYSGRVEAQVTVTPGQKGRTTVTTSFSQDCTVTSQVCGHPIALPLSLFRGGKLDVQYTAPPAHCSDVRVLFFLDGAPVGATAFTKPTGTVHTRLQLKKSSGRLSFDAEGREGGCNTGLLSGWGGTLVIGIAPTSCLGKLAPSVTVPAAGATVVVVRGGVEVAPAGSQAFGAVGGSVALPAAGFQVRTLADAQAEVRTSDGRLYLIAPESTVMAEAGDPPRGMKLVTTATLDDPILARVKKFKKGPGGYLLRKCPR
jgi:hypothetical protein